MGERRRGGQVGLDCEDVKCAVAKLAVEHSALEDPVPFGLAGVSFGRVTLIDKRMYTSSATTAVISKVNPENWILGEDLLRPCPLHSATALLLLTTATSSISAPRAAELMGAFRPLLPPDPCRVLSLDPPPGLTGKSHIPPHGALLLGNLPRRSGSGGWAMRRTDSAMGWRARLVCPAADLIGEICCLIRGRRDGSRRGSLICCHLGQSHSLAPVGRNAPGTPCRGFERKASGSFHPPSEATELSQGHQAAAGERVYTPRLCKRMGGGVTWLGINPRNSLSQPLLSTHEAAAFGTSAPPGTAFLLCPALGSGGPIRGEPLSREGRRNGAGTRTRSGREGV